MSDKYIDLQDKIVSIDETLDMVIERFSRKVKDIENNKAGDDYHELYDVLENFDAIIEDASYKVERLMLEIDYKKEE